MKLKVLKDFGTTREACEYLLSHPINQNLTFQELYNLQNWLGDPNAKLYIWAANFPIENIVHGIFDRLYTVLGSELAKQQRSPELEL